MIFDDPVRHCSSFVAYLSRISMDRISISISIDRPFDFSLFCHCFRLLRINEDGFERTIDCSMKIRVVLVQKNDSLRSDNDSIGIKDDENPLAVTIRMCSRYAPIYIVNGTEFRRPVILRPLVRINSISFRLVSSSFTA